MKTLPRRRRRLFSSLGFVNFLLLVIALAAAFGTLPPRFKLLSFDPPEIYRTKGFLFLLGILAFLAFAFVVRKVLEFLPSLEAGCERQKSFSLSEPIKAESKVPFALTWARRGQALEALTGHGYHVETEENQEECRYTASKNRWGKSGTLLIHLGLGIVLWGGFLTFLFSDIRDITLEEGETISLPGLSSKVRLEKFVPLFGPESSVPENYVSRLLIEEKGGGIQNEELKVNRPLRLGPAKLFQMRYEVRVLEIRLSVYHRGKPVERIDLKPGEKKALKGFPFFVEAEEVIPDFVTDGKGNVASRSPYFRNPAALISIVSTASPGIIPEKKWAFRGLAFHPKEERQEWDFVIEKVKKRYYSGIKFSKDPGVPWAYAGFIFLVLGAFISGFVVPRTFILRLSASTTGKETVMEIFYPQTKDSWGTRKELLRFQSRFLRKISEVEG